MRPSALIGDAAHLKQDFTQLKSLSRKDQHEQLRELTARGDHVTAVYAARRLYGGSLGQATQMVDALSQGKVAQ